jgi:inhibitor of KinA sporulation pathway (predicted exonuclease)
MAKQHDAVVVVDVESTCWQGGAPEGQASEIIEIGVCLLDVATGERRERERLLVRPERSTVSPFCTALTGLTQAEVDAGISFGEACAQLAERFMTRSRIWASYGEYDRQMFEAGSAAAHVPYPFGTRHLNVKALVALVCGLPDEVGMARALRILGLPLEGTHHRGADDAWNIAGILSRLLLERREAVWAIGKEAGVG